MIRGKGKIVAAAVCATLGMCGSASAKAVAVPQSTDSWQSAEHLTPSTWFTTSNSTATIGAAGTEDLTRSSTSGNRICLETSTQMYNTLWWFVTGTGGRIILTTKFSAVDSLLATYPAGAQPGGNNAQFCADDNVAGSDDARIVIDNSVAGARYYVQAGSCDRYWDGAQWVLCGNRSVGGMSIAAITNDQRAQADTATSGTRANLGATTDQGEVTTCNGANYGSTVWFKYTATQEGNLNVEASRFDTVLALYRGNETQPLACAENSRPEDPLTERLRHYVTPGDYYIQVGGKGAQGSSAQDNFSYGASLEVDLDLDKDGSPRPDDCNDNNANVRPGKQEIAHNNVDDDCRNGDSKDEDGDGHDADFAGGRDCNDKNRVINPDATDRANNGVDEDCRNGDAAGQLPTTPQVSFISAPYRKGVVFGTMYIRGLRKGYRIDVRCTGSRSCPKRIRRTSRGSRVTLNSFVRKAFGTGTRVEIRVTVPGNVIGFYKSYTVRGRKNPKQRVCQLDPGRAAPVRC